MGMPLQPVLFPEIEGPDFIRFDEVNRVAADVLTRHGRIGGVARVHPIARAVDDEELHVLFLLNDKPFDEDHDELTHETIGKCIKAPKLWHDVTGFDAVIWVLGYYWKHADATAREALLLHELLHLQVDRDENSQVKLKVRKHDVEDFTDVVRHYGPLHGEGPAFIRAAALFAGDTGTPKPTRLRSVVDGDAPKCDGSNHVPGCEHFVEQPTNP